jgi:epsilon-lactone hydrolase
MLYFIIRSFIHIYSRTIKIKNYVKIRKRLDLLASRFLRLPKTCSVTPADASGVPAEWVSWQGIEEGRTVLYLHGGGYVLFSPRTHRELVSRIARASGARALSLDYRLAPEYPHPAAVDDTVKAYKWLLECGVSPSSIAVMGDSAGGGLTLALLQILRDNKIPLPACAVCLSPWADLTCSGESHIKNSHIDPMLPQTKIRDYAKAYMQGGDLSQPSASPLFGDFSNLPPILIHVGTDEILLDDSRRVAEKASKTNTKIELKIWPRMIHVFQALAHFVPEGKQSIREIGEFVKRNIP